jgi:hypothetical protein
MKEMTFRELFDMLFNMKEQVLDCKVIVQIDNKWHTLSSSFYESDDNLDCPIQGEYQIYLSNKDLYNGGLRL